ncbi:hypothetical protein OAV62_02215 [bacterium]|nr:hypothetical protein [bacterium]
MATAFVNTRKLDTLAKSVMGVVDVNHITVSLIFALIVTVLGYVSTKNCFGSVENVPTAAKHFVRSTVAIEASVLNVRKLEQAAQVYVTISRCEPVVPCVMG